MILPRSGNRRPRGHRSDLPFASTGTNSPRPKWQAKPRGGPQFSRPEASNTGFAPEPATSARDSEFISHRDPVAPVFDRLARRLVRFQRIELHERHAELAAGEMHENEHLPHAVVPRCHAEDLDLLALLERRNLARGDALRLEGKAQLVVEMAVPADRALLGRVGVDDDFVGDAVFASAVRCRALWFTHR